jgi:hypothetical protein
MKIAIIPSLGVLLLLASVHVAPAQQPSAAERAVALKAQLAASQAILKQYEWIETTVVSVKGDEKSRQMHRCYHGADGKVAKIPLTTPPPEEKKRGLRGRIIEAKKEEMTEYMKDAVALVKQYVPPDQARIQAAKDAGRISISPQPGQRARLTFAGFVKSGDSFAVDLDLAANRPLQATVSTFMDSDKEPVTLDVRFGMLDSNASYASTTTLEAKGKDLKVTVENSGYKRQ